MLELKEISDRLDIIIKLLDNLQPADVKINPPVLPDFARNHTCSKCGMNFKGATAYVCVNNDCPMGMGPTVC